MRILVAEDDPISRRLLEAKLTKWGYEVIIASNGDEAWRIFQSQDAPRIAILDWMMPGVDGVELCRRLRREAKEPYTYIILLTALQGEKDLITGMQAGADDYITKPFKAQELKVRLRAGRRIIELQTELMEARDALREKAIRDPLTGLWNHEEILHILEQQVSKANREDGYVSAIMADLDHFKQINDTHGHMAGDVVLRMTAQKLLEQVRPYDSIGRYGGEEFLLVLPGCDRECAMVLAERLRLCICQDCMDVPEGLIPVSISMGVATKNKESHCDANCLVQAADAALYRAKKNGRNRMEVDSWILTETLRRPDDRASAESGSR